MAPYTFPFRDAIGFDSSLGDELQYSSFRPLLVFRDGPIDEMIASIIHVVHVLLKNMDFIITDGFVSARIRKLHFTFADYIFTSVIPHSSIQISFVYLSKSTLPNRSMATCGTIHFFFLRPFFRIYIINFHL